MSRKSKGVFHQIGPWWVNDVTLEKTPVNDDPDIYDVFEVEEERQKLIKRGKKALAAFTVAFREIAKVGSASMPHNRRILVYEYRESTKTVGHGFLPIGAELKYEILARTYRTADLALSRVNTAVDENTFRLDRALRLAMPELNVSQDSYSRRWVLRTCVNGTNYMYYLTRNRYGAFIFEPFFFPDHYQDSAFMSRSLDMPRVRKLQSLKAGSAKWLLSEGKKVSDEIHRR